MKNNITELVFILDRSASMHGFESDTVGGFNATVDEQKKLSGKVYVSTVLFDNYSEVIHDRVDIKRIAPMTEKDYKVRGCTALLDAIGDAIHHVRNIHKYAREEDVPEHTVFVINTDGMENASSKYDSDTVKSMIKKQTDEEGWEFIFLASNIDAVESAARIGIDRARAVDYKQDTDGIHASFASTSDAISAVRCRKALDATDWRGKADRDFARSKKDK